MGKKQSFEQLDRCYGSRVRNSFDMLARDVAFEIALGGDRFDPQDAAMWLDGCSDVELEVFRSRIRYHIVDFAPPEYRTEDFVGRMIQEWTESVRTDDTRHDIRPGVQEALEIRDRGKWYRFSDGYRQCTKGTVEAEWTAKDLSMRLSPDPVPSNEVLRARADSLISRYGHEVMLDYRYDSLDISSLGFSGEDVSMTLRRSVDVVAQGVEGHSYTVVERRPGDVRVSEIMSFTPEEADRLIAVLDTEESLRQSSALVSERSAFADGVLVGFPEPVRVSMVRDDAGLFPFEVSSVFCTPDGQAMVSGRYMHQPRKEPEYNYPLSDLTDKGISDVRRAMDVAMRNTLERLQGVGPKRMETLRPEGARKSGPSL